MVGFVQRISDDDSRVVLRGSLAAKWKYCAIMSAIELLACRQKLLFQSSKVLACRHAKKSDDLSDDCYDDDNNESDE